MAETFDVIVVGAGNAALAASVSAKENGAERVLVLEKAPREMRGGNTHWSGGVLRFAFDDPHEIGPLVPGVEEEFDKLHRALRDAAAVVAKEGVPRFYVRTLMELEDAVNIVTRAATK